jgi:acyl-CoA synthetase (AMP-forming)/AMP-acid ligase II
MLGLMQDRPLMISAIIAHAARSHGQAEVVSRTLEGDIHRTTYSAIERRARRLARHAGGLPHDQSPPVA